MTGWIIDGWVNGCMDRCKKGWINSRTYKASSNMAYERERGKHTLGERQALECTGSGVLVRVHKRLI